MGDLPESAETIQGNQSDGAHSHVEPEWESSVLQVYDGAGLLLPDAFSFFMSIKFRFTSSLVLGFFLFRGGGTFLCVTSIQSFLISFKSCLSMRNSQFDLGDS